MFQRGDVPAIAALHTDSWRKHDRGIWADAYLDGDFLKERSASWLKRMSVPATNQKVMVACNDDIIIGFTCIFFNDAPFFGSLPDNLHVVARWQGTGTRSILIKNAARFLYKMASEKKLYLWVS